MTEHFRVPSLKKIIIWLIVISCISFTFGGVITVLDGGRYAGNVGEKEIQLVIPPESAERAMISLEMVSGKMNVSTGRGDALLSGTIRSIYARNGPEKSYSVENGIGMLSLSQESSMFLDPLEKVDDWNLTLQQNIPFDLSLKSGTGEIRLDVGNAKMTSLRIDAGAGDVTVDLTTWKGSHLPVSISSGLGSLSVILPRDTSIAAETSNGFGSRTISGLDGEDGHYYHNDPVPGSPVISLAIKQGLGDLTLVTDH